MRRILAGTAIAATAALYSVGTAAPASAICRYYPPLPVCLPACPLPDPHDPLPYACPL